MKPEDLTRLARNIDLSGAAPPKEFRLFAAGPIETTKGMFVFDSRAAELVMQAAQDWGNDYPVDYDHAMGAWLAMDPAESGKAAGWFKPELRNGELWATSVSWTPAAAKKLADREYRYTSPAFRTEEEGGRISELVNVALTNLPATKKQPPLMASRIGEGKEAPMKLVALALSLAEGASEAEVLAAVTSLRDFTGRVLAELGVKSQAEALGTLAGWKGNAAQIATLSAKIDEYKAKEVAAEVEAMIADGKNAGKITPSTEANVRQIAKDHGPVALKSMIAAMQAAPKPLEDPTEEGGAGLDPHELAVAKERGLDIKKLAAEKAKAIKEGRYPGATA